MKNINGITLETVDKSLPTRVEDTPKETEDSCDDRYKYIKEQLKKIRSMEKNKSGVEPADI